MPSIPIHPVSRQHENGGAAVLTNPLPELLQTPGGLALLEIQGTLHTGEVKKLPKSIAILRKRDKPLDNAMEVDDTSADAAESVEELEIVEIVKYKLLFASRPEPVGD